MTPQAASAPTSGPKKAKPGDFELESVRIERASNGYTVAKHFRLKRDVLAEGYREPESAVFNNAGEMIEYVRDCFVGRGRR
jgi:hypothetical protein